MTIQYITGRLGIDSEDLERSGWTGPGWYFWDETQAYCHGPYESKEATEEKLELYVRNL